MQTHPQTRDLVLIGGGHAHALVLLRWAMQPLPGARLSVIDPNPVAPYTGMLPGLIAGHYARENLEMNLVALARRAGARLILGRAEGIDPEARLIHVPGRPPLAYDIASIDIGITSNLPDLPGFSAHGIAAKPLGGYAERWAAFVASVAAGQAPPQVAILGAGVGGVELALAMDHRLRDAPDRRITLIERDTPLPHLGRAARTRLLALLATRGITLLQGEAASVSATAVTLTDGRILPAALTLGAAGSRPQPWLATTGLHLTEGFVTVDPTLRSVSHPQIFATGDCAHMRDSPRPKAGVFAVRQAPVLFDNLRAALAGTALRPFRPQRDYLKLISLGGREALADKWGLPLAGRWLWRLKDRIDQRFMRMVQDLPAMQGPALPATHAQGLAEMLAEAPLCGGCGAKVGPGLLRQALAGLDPVRAELGIGDDAALLRMGEARQVIATDHLRAVTDDPFLMARLATLHALGDIWAMGAQPQAALLSLILPRLAEPLQARTLTEILAGVKAALDGTGAELIGGHTTQGSELTIGLTVSGLVGAHLTTKGGARPGDALILTRAIGSGTILAAEMRGLAPGRAVAALWPALLHSQAGASRLLAPLAHAMTDVTGFGLAGHLDELLRASGMGADLDLAAIPVLDGAESLAAAGIASTIAPANRAALLGRIAAPRGPRTDLLFDPQTAGGLLAAVPAAAAPALLDALRDQGYPAARIGTVTGLTDGPALRCTGAP
mgnify:CR=1 FL=1